MDALQIASYGRDVLGLPYSTASTLIIILNGAGLPFRVIPPLVADRIGPINVLLPVAAFWGIVAWCWFAVGSVTQYYVFTAFYGVASGAFQCLIPTTVASITLRLDMVGTRLGMAFSVVSFAALTGPPIGGALLAADDGKYRGAQIWAACATTLSLFLFGAARVHRVGWDVKSKC